MGSIEAPFVDPDACTGCGLCEYRCHTTYTKQEHFSRRVRFGWHRNE